MPEHDRISQKYLYITLFRSVVSQFHPSFIHIATLMYKPWIKSIPKSLNMILKHVFSKYASIVKLTLEHARKVEFLMLVICIEGFQYINAYEILSQRLLIISFPILGLWITFKEIFVDLFRHLHIHLRIYVSWFLTYFTMKPYCYYIAIFLLYTWVV